jgi:hypothetical protein
MSSPLNRYVIDVDNVEANKLVARNSYHDCTMNKPCNCNDCLIYALTYGVSKVSEEEGPDGVKVWMPDLCEEDMQILCFSADHVRKTFTSTCVGDITVFASAMVTNSWKAARKDRSGDRVFFMADKKRKAKEVTSAGPKDANPGTPKKANTAMSAGAMMPKSASAEEGIEVVDMEGKE